MKAINIIIIHYSHRRQWGVGIGRWVASVCLSVSVTVCLSICSRSERKTVWTINTKLDTGTWIVRDRPSACIACKRSRSCPARWYKCLDFLVNFLLLSILSQVQRQITCWHQGTEENGDFLLSAYSPIEWLQLNRRSQCSMYIPAPSVVSTPRHR